MDPRGIRDCHEQALEGREALKRREGDLSTLTARVRAPVVAIAAHDEGNFLLGVGLNELLDIKFLMLIAYLDSVNELGEYYLPGVIDAKLLISRFDSRPADFSWPIRTVLRPIFLRILVNSSSEKAPLSTSS